MEPNSFGRKLGISVRVVAHMVRERAADAAQAGPTLSAQEFGSTIPRARNVATKTRSLGRASKRFGEAIWGPMVHVSGVLWLEITGLFFALFMLFFAQSVYRLRHSYRAGADHQRFLLYCALTLVFTYFTVSSFYRARRKERKVKR